MSDDICLSCVRGFYEECGHEPPQHNALSQTDVSEESKRYAHDNITVSGGRKRAAELYPLNREEYCEWRLLADCGGGSFPILGCLTGKQVHRHHGPVKTTTRNERTNIHLICSSCHNLWHAKNDKVYDPALYDTLPHNPREMTPAEILRTR